MARLFVTEIGNLPVWGATFNDQIPPESWSLIATYDEYTYEILHQKFSDNVKNATWDAQLQTLTINSVIEIDTNWIETALIEFNSINAIISSKLELSSRVSLARNHASTIKTLFNTILDQTITQTVQPSRFNTLRNIITDSPQAFRDRIIIDIQQELGLDVTGVLSAAQQRQVCLYLRIWTTGLALLLTLA